MPSTLGDICLNQGFSWADLQGRVTLMSLLVPSSGADREVCDCGGLGRLGRAQHFKRWLHK